MNPPDQTPTTVSIIIPAWNEAARLGGTLKHVHAYACTCGRPIEVIIVDDGSTDGTARCVAEWIDRIGAARGDWAVTWRSIPGGDDPPEDNRHRGKGHAVRRGMLAATGDILLMCDADLSTPIDELDRLLPWFEQGYDVVIGSRRMPDSVLDPPQPWTRRVMDSVFRAIRRRCLLPDIQDTQCGFKCFTKAAAKEVFARAQIDGFAFDCEVLALVRASGYRIKEIGVTWHNDPDSRVRPIRDSVSMLLGVMRIRKRYQRHDAPVSDKLS